jgi:hypothetical protein
MDEPSAADRAIRLSNLVKTAPPPVVDLPILLDHTPHNLGHTFGSDTEAIVWLMHRDQGSAYSVHLSTSTRSHRELIQGLGLVRPSHRLAAPVGEATRGHPVFIHAVIYHLPPQDVRQERGGHVETATTPAELRLIVRAIAARAQGLIEGCRRVRVCASILVLIVAGKFGSRRGKLP